MSQDPTVVETGVGLKRLFGLIFHGRRQSFGLSWAQRGSQQGSVSHHNHLMRDFFWAGGGLCDEVGKFCIALSSGNFWVAEIFIDFGVSSI